MNSLSARSREAYSFVVVLAHENENESPKVMLPVTSRQEKVLEVLNSR